MSGRPAVLISIVSFNSERDLERCLLSALRQTVPARVKVHDNDSHDRSPAIAAESGVTIFSADRNVGFCAAHNRNLRGEEFDFALLLNPDCVLSPDFVERALQAFRATERVGMVGGKLRKLDELGRELRREGHAVIDSTGIFFTPTQRHFDRGSGQLDVGQFERRELVFGITGAALLASRAMLQDVSRNGEYLDESFFAYREDADLAWRAQLRGWKAVYEPSALGWHRRSVHSKGRAGVAATINYHSVKNRFLMRSKNLDWRVRRRCFPWMWVRDCGIFLYILIRERRSLGALGEAFRLRSRMALKRGVVFSGPVTDVSGWFSFWPKSKPIGIRMNHDGPT